MPMPFSALQIVVRKDDRAGFEVTDPRTTSEASSA